MPNCKQRDVRGNPRGVHGMGAGVKKFSWDREVNSESRTRL